MNPSTRHFVIVATRAYRVLCVSSNRMANCFCELSTVFDQQMARSYCFHIQNDILILFCHSFTRVICCLSETPFSLQPYNHTVTTLSLHLWFYCCPSSQCYVFYLSFLFSFHYNTQLSLHRFWVILYQFLITFQCLWAQLNHRLVYTVLHGQKFSFCCTASLKLQRL